jgi:hypothetical protein
MRVLLFREGHALLFALVSTNPIQIQGRDRFAHRCVHRRNNILLLPNHFLSEIWNLSGRWPRRSGK